MRQRSFLHSLNDAIEGFIYVVRHERNMRVHFLFAFFVLLLAAVLGVSRLEWIILSTIVCFVLVAEMVNTAIEETIDLIKDTFHPVARIVKHISAGIVLLSVANAVIVGFFIFSNYWSWPLEAAVFHIRQTSWLTTFTALLVVVFLVIASKAFFRRGRPLKGGIVSGHAAAAFSLWTVVLFSQTSVLVVGVTFILALLVAMSRSWRKIHSAGEIIAGALLGVLVTALFFQIFRT